MVASEQSGLDFNNALKDNASENILLYSNFYGGAGVGVGDFNEDGLEDIFFAGNQVTDQLYFNQGDFTFKNVSKAAGIIQDSGWSTGVTVADINADGHLDIYVSRELFDNKESLRANLLYINDGKGKFTESAADFGLNDTERTRHASFLDYDKDGLLDLLLLTQPPNPGSYSAFFGTKLRQPKYHLKLFKNLGSNRFKEVSEQAGVNLIGYPNGVCVADLNNDGWQDIYIANDFEAPDFMFINQKDGRFINEANERLGQMSFYAMGVDIADLDNDSHPEIFTLDMVAEDNFRLKSNMSGMNPASFWKVVNEGGHYQYMYNALQHNNGNGRFSNLSQYTGMAATDWSWSTLMADFDNDGYKDVYITNGLLYDIRNTDADKKVASYVSEFANDWVSKNPNAGDVKLFDILDIEKTIGLLPSVPLKNYAFKNNGGMQFEKSAQNWGLDQASFSNGAAYADFDNDGDLDIVVSNINAPAFLYRNNVVGQKSSNYLRIELDESQNKSVLGTKLYVYHDNQVQFIEAINAKGIYSTSENTLHFGLGKSMQADSLVVKWPNNKKQTMYNIAANQKLVLHMDEAQLPSAAEDNSPTIFREADPASLSFKHQENDFDDYAPQVLLPHKMSQFGPALAKADVNGDGLEDLYLGGATNQAGRLLLQQKEGGFLPSNTELLTKESPYEDVDALFLDINGDSYPDLYVVSGGNAYKANDFHYSDRVYMNDGKGNFKKGAIVGIARTSGGVVKASDIDADGDLDLYVGGRHVPHQYPSPATSMLLINNKGQLENATERLAPDFKHIGMVTDAVWTDYDQDGDQDLMMVGEWMPLTMFENKNGVLNKIALKDFENTSGWWFSLASKDMDGDGDPDYVVGNLGLNYKYKTSEKAPFDVYYNDFDGNGQYDIVLGYYNENKHFPLRGFSCSSEQVPILKSTFKKYDVFASLQIEEVYGEDNLKQSLHYKTQTFASYYIENKGGGVFELQELPAQAQWTNLNDILLDDFDKDGHLDILAVGNLFVSEIETPRNDAGLGLFLKGNSKGQFESIPMLASGFYAPLDAKKVISMDVQGKPHIVVVNNNAPLQLFELRN
ncbi:MAG: VCBS repeat-containing protein [Flavobacteriia bacterium]|nr:VCBS repeat-containing protein [Flavobacteriia bacterium]